MIRYDPARTPSPEVLEALEALLASGAVRTCHYFGYAHEPILRILHNHLGSQFSVLDYWHRWGTETEFDEDTGARIHESRRPDWLREIPFYNEGAAPHELLIRDMPWSYPGQLADIAAFRGRQPPTHVLLADEARSAATHPAYDWTVTRAYALGVSKTWPA